MIRAAPVSVSMPESSVAPQRKPIERRGLLITGPGGSLGDALVRNPKAQTIAFTGATAVGLGSMRGGADALKHLAIELGGKSPNMILADAANDMTISREEICGPVVPVTPFEGEDEATRLADPIRAPRPRKTTVSTRRSGRT